MRNQLVESFNRQRDLDLLKIVCDGIALGMWPFKTGNIIAWRTDNLSLEPNKLTFELENFRELPFVARQSLSDLNEYVMTTRMAIEAFRFYRYRPALPVDDHIILGEE